MKVQHKILFHFRTVLKIYQEDGQVPIRRKYLGLVVVVMLLLRHQIVHHLHSINLTLGLCLDLWRMSRVRSIHMLQCTNCGICQGYAVHICYRVPPVAYVKGMQYIYVTGYEYVQLTVDLWRMSRVCSTYMLQGTNMFSWLWICGVCQGYVVHMSQGTTCLIGCGSVAYVKGIQYTYITGYEYVQFAVDLWRMSRVCSAHMLQGTNMLRWLWICGVCQEYVVHICYRVRTCLGVCGSVVYVKGMQYTYVTGYKTCLVYTSW